VLVLARVRNVLLRRTWDGCGHGALICTKPEKVAQNLRKLQKLMPTERTPPRRRENRHSVVGPGLPAPTLPQIES
jgi:hypothetical protein